jgi:putative two-component system response regulator
MAESIALYHHERWDGRGYHGLVGDATPLEARIVSLVDAFDVITHTRQYKKAESAAAAMESIRQERGHQFDPALVDIFTQMQPSEDLGRLSEATNEGAATPAERREQAALRP